MEYLVARKALQSDAPVKRGKSHAWRVCFELEAEGRLKAQLLFVVVMAALFAATSAQASVEISANPTQNMDCTDGVCTPTAKNAVLNATFLANMLATSDVKVVTGSGAVTITVSSSFSWTSTHRLTLDAYYNVSFRAPVVVAGQGAVTIVTNDGGTGGDLLFFTGATLDFWDLSSNLFINGNNYKLEKRLSGLAEDIKARPSGLFALANNYDSTRSRPYREPPVPTPLSGVFEGLGHAISNLDIAPKDSRKHQVPDVGLFAGIATGGLVRDIIIANGKIDTHAQQVSAGLLAAGNAGTIVNSASSGSVTLNSFSYGAAGGLVGGNSGTIARSYTSGVVSSGQYADGGGLAGVNLGVISHSYSTSEVDGCNTGGLVAENLGPSGLIEWSHATGSVYGCITAGGLAYGNSGAINNSFATGSVSGEWAGGLVAQNAGTISLTYATGAVTGGYEGFAGGLIGYNHSGSIVQNSYATGAVSGGDDQESNGGLIGTNYCSGHCTIESVYSTGLVSADQFKGGVVGSDHDLQYQDFQSAYWDLDTSGISDPAQGAGNIQDDPGITGLTDIQLKSGLPAGFDKKLWGQNPNINHGYPYLINNPPPK